jgi:L-2-hydroxyglutarate oxidase LhgO
VIHAGVRARLLRARLCVEGSAVLREYCARDIPVNVNGKLIVATSEAEMPRLELERQRPRQWRRRLAGSRRRDRFDRTGASGWRIHSPMPR